MIRVGKRKTNISFPISLRKFMRDDIKNLKRTMNQKCEHMIVEEIYEIHGKNKHVNEEIIFKVIFTKSSREILLTTLLCVHFEEVLDRKVFYKH